MNTPSQLVPHILSTLVPRTMLRALLCALCVGVAFAVNALAQTAQGQGAVTQPVGATHVAAAAAQSQTVETSREKRAQAYAKLLEGQRYFAGAREGRMTVEGLRLAQQAFQQAAELDPTLAEAHTALAELAFFFLDDLPQAARESSIAARLDPNNLGAHRTLSRVYTVRSNFSEGKIDRAVAEQATAELKEVARLSPNDAEAWALLGELYLASGRENESVEALKKWAALPASIDSRFYQVITKGKELTPDAASARLSEVLLRAGRTDEAVAAIRRALSLEPNNGRYLEMLGDALEAGGAVDQNIVNELRNLVTQNPKNAVAVGMLARAQTRANRVEDAVATLRAGISATAGNERDQVSLQLQLAQTYADASLYDDAIGVHENLLKARKIGDAPLASERDRRFASVVFASILGLQQQAGQFEKAFATIERMRLVLGDKDPAADIQKVNLLRTQGKRAEALEAVRAARVRYPEEERLLRLEAFTLADMGRVDEALGLFRRRLKG
ncbi:MAG: tetratricopeptide repeat protein, partial [Pyrinomonadaceae bacterium]